MLQHPLCVRKFHGLAYLSPLTDLVRAVNSDIPGRSITIAEKTFTECFCCPTTGELNALELLDLKPGMSLLVLGSRFGYFNVLAGLILGHRGVNHGVHGEEIMVSDSTDSVEKFLSRSPSVDKYDFCRPEFFTGGIPELPSGVAYDRVYCTWRNYGGSEDGIKRLVRDGGVLVFRNFAQLEKLIKTGGNIFERVVQYTCTSCPPLFNNYEGKNSVRLPERNPSTLKELCRVSIRASLKKKVETNPEFLRERKLLSDLKEELRWNTAKKYRFDFGSLRYWLTSEFCEDGKRRYEESYARELSSYSREVKRSILNLPVPQSLKRYLNFHRPF